MKDISKSYLSKKINKLNKFIERKIKMMKIRYGGGK